MFSRGPDVIDAMTSLTLAPPHEQITAPLDSTDAEPILDALPLLDHRTLQRAIGRPRMPSCSSTA